LPRPLTETEFSVGDNKIWVYTHGLSGIFLFFLPRPRYVPAYQAILYWTSMNLRKILYFIFFSHSLIFWDILMNIWRYTLKQYKWQEVALHLSSPCQTTVQIPFATLDAITP